MKMTSIRTHPRLIVATAGLMLVVGAGAAYAGVSAHARAGGGRGAIANAIATDLGITRQQLRSDLSGGQTLAQLAAANGTSVNGLEQTILGAAQSRLDQAVAAGLLTSQKEQAALSQVSARIGTLVNVEHPGAHVAVALRLRLKVVRVTARYLGLTPQQLRSEVSSGQTLAQVTTASGKTASGLEQAVQTALKTRLDQSVTKGKLSTRQEQTLLGDVQTRLETALAS
jgi:hypothetical protein